MAGSASRILKEGEFQLLEGGKLGALREQLELREGPQGGRVVNDSP